MPIQVSTIIAQVETLLDVVGSDRYTYGRDHAPAINITLDAISSILSSLIDEKKFSSEALRELNKTVLYTASSFGRIHFFGLNRVMSILGVYPEAAFTGVLGTGTLNPYQSRYEREAAFVSSPHSAKRLTQEEWNRGADNIFLEGNTVMTGAQKRYAYMWTSDYTAEPNYVPGGEEMDIRPIPPAPFLVGVAYIKSPDKLVFTAADVAPPAGATIELPESMTPIVVAQVCAYLAEQQGDGTNLWTVSARDLRNQLAAIS